MINLVSKPFHRPQAPANAKRELGRDDEARKTGRILLRRPKTSEQQKQIAHLDANEKIDEGLN